MVRQFATIRGLGVDMTDRLTSEHVLRDIAIAGHWRAMLARRDHRMESAQCAARTGWSKLATRAFETEWPSSHGGS